MDENICKKAASLIMIGFPGYDLPPEYEDFILQASPGGLILFRRNLHDEEQVSRLCEKLHALGKQRGSPNPFLIAIDQEGGLVNRAENMLLPLPSALSLGVKDEPSLVYDISAYVAGTLRSWGIDINFAPVVDLYNPLNRQLLTRSFGADWQKVVSLTRAFIRGCSDQGIIPCIKHFPGLGRCLPDTHHYAGVVHADRSELELHDLQPFRALSQDGVPMVMVSHAEFPALSGDYAGPASLSSAIMTGLLRHDIGFSGVCVSDDLEMRAITSRRSIPEATVLALKAGCDLVLICHSLDEQTKTIKTLEHACAEGELDRLRIEEACSRIERLALIQRTGPGEMDNTGLSRLSEDIDGVFRLNLDVIRDQHSLIPLSHKFYEKITVVFHLNRSVIESERSLIRSFVERLAGDCQIVDLIQDRDFFDEAVNTENESACLSVLIGHNWQKAFETLFAGFPARLKRNTIVLLTGDPAENTLLPPEATCLVLANNAFRAIELALERIC